MYKRLKTPEVIVGQVAVGGKNPIRIQSMTNTPTADVAATVSQCVELIDAGSELVRVTVDDQEAAAAVPEIRRQLDKRGFAHIPVIGDFHFNGHRLLADNPACAAALAKYRINPGNVGYGRRHTENFKTIIKIAVQHQKPVRIGVNVGSLDRELLNQMMDKNARLSRPQSDHEVLIKAMVKSALDSAYLAEKFGLKRNQIILSVKMSDLPQMLAAYQLLAKEMVSKKRIYSLHLGLTEAGSGMQGLVSSSAALSILLNQGIGDTIRVSLTPAPNESRAREVEACKLLLQSLGFRDFQPKITSCPGCGRATGTFFQDLAAEVHKHINKRMPDWQKKYPAVTRLKIAVMGCVVNGPGESRSADIAISLPGKNEPNLAPVFINGKPHKTLMGGRIPQEFIEILEEYIQSHYSSQ